jgi:hypothetical protein
MPMQVVIHVTGPVVIITDPDSIEGAETMAGLDDVKREVTELKTVNASVKALLANLAERIRNAGNNEAELAAIAADLDSEAGGLAAAVTANTPAEPGGGSGNQV